MLNHKLNCHPKEDFSPDFQQLFQMIRIIQCFHSLTSGDVVFSTFYDGAQQKRSLYKAKRGAITQCIYAYECNV